MKVLFLKDVGGAGQAGSIKEVSDGYGMNYLIVRGLAVQATPEEIKKHEKRVGEKRQASANEERTLAEQLKAADKQRVVIKAKANEKGHLFKGVKQEDVADAIANAFGSFIAPDTIQGFEGVIRETGEHAIHLVGAGVEATVQLVVEAAQ